MEIKSDVVLDKRKNRLIKNFTRTTKNTLAQLKEIKGYSKNIEYYFDVMQDVFITCSENSDTYKDKQVGVYGVNMFDELIYAAGLKPVWLSGGSHTAGILADEYVPRDVDPIIRSSIGYSISNLIPLYKNCSAVIISSTTDGERKMTALLSKYINVIPIDIPPVRCDVNSQKRFLEQMYQLKSRLEDISGNKINAKSMKEAVDKVYEAEIEGKRLYEIRKHNPSVISGCHSSMAINTYAYLDVKEWTRHTRALNDELEKSIENKQFIMNSIAPRIVITGSSMIFPNMKIPLIIEEMGGVVVADETMIGNRFIYDSIETNGCSINDIIINLCRKYYMNDISSFFMFNQKRILRIKSMLSEYQVDGVIYHVLKGDVVCDFELPRLEEMLKYMDIPILRVETDYNPEDVEQLKIRVEAFIEMISSKKQNTHTI